MSLLRSDAESNAESGDDRPGSETGALHLLLSSIQLRFRPLLATIVISTHCYALVVFGATYWIDTMGYISMGDALTSAENLKVFYGPVGTFLYAHVGMGTPVVWWLAAHLPETWRWPAVAVSQHALASWTLFFSFSTLNRIWPSPILLLTCLLLCLHPFYQSMNNALLTESMSASFTLLGLAFALRLFYEPAWSFSRLFGLISAAFLAGQIRSYLGLMVTLAGLIVCLAKRPPVPKSAFVYLLAGCALATMALPVCRYAGTGRFFMPDAGLNNLVWAFWVNPNPSKNVERFLETIPFPPDISVAGMLQKGLSYDQAAVIGDFWLHQGMTDTEVRRRGKAISDCVLHDRPSLYLTRLRFGFCSAGFGWLAFAGSDKDERFQGITAKQEQQHQLDHYRWLSWTTSNSHKKRMVTYFKTIKPFIPFGTQAQEQALQFLSPYLSHCSSRYRDPLFLALIPPDFWTLLGLVSAAVIFLRDKITASLLLLPFLITLAVTAKLGLPGIRYCYVLIPVALIAFSISLAMIRCLASTSRV